MPPIKKIIRDVINVIDVERAHRAEHHAARKTRIKSLMHDVHDAVHGTKRARAVDGDDKEARRQAILDAADRLFAERQSLANVADVAEAAGLAKGTVYLYFQTKEEIYLALHLRHVEVFFSTMISRLNSPQPFRFNEMLSLAEEHILYAPTYMPLGACCIGFAANAVPLEAAMNFQAQMTTLLLTAGQGLERHFPKLAAGEGVRLLKHSYAMMIGLFSLRGERQDEDPKCPRIPGLGSYQEEASLALTRYWSHVTGVPEADMAIGGDATHSSTTETTTSRDSK